MTHFLSLFCLVVAINVSANETTEDFLARFYQNPKKVMEEIPLKFNEDNVAVDDNISIIPLPKDREIVAEIKRSFIDDLIAKIQGNQNKALIADDYTNEKGFLVTDRIEQLVDNPDHILKNIVEMDKKKLKAKKLPERPWSSDYWQINQGIIAFRYNDPKMPKNGEWIDYYKYSMEENPPLTSMKKIGVKNLSPAEKYDLLVGDENFTLTQAMWNEGKNYWDRFNKVDTWMGICNGWAAASLNVPRPLNAITVKSVDGTSIRFYPADIKALAALLYANGKTQNKFIGSRCEETDPAKDENGRIISPECFDTNPGTWHMAVVNQVGISKRGFVFDKSSDSQVWNQPIYGYEYRYFNPQTNKTTDVLKEAMIPYSTFTHDLFEKYRSDKVVNVVGIEMTVQYMLETDPNHKGLDLTFFDASRKVVYRYDLELDKDNNILGGEWYQNAHPDFIWAPEKDSTAVTNYEDEAESEWKSKHRRLPSDWAAAGMKSSMDSTPLSKIVMKLVEFSRKKQIPLPF